MERPMRWTGSKLRSCCIAVISLVRCAGTEGRPRRCHASFSVPTQCQMCLADWPRDSSAVGPFPVKVAARRSVSVPVCRCRRRVMSNTFLGLSMLQTSHASPCSAMANRGGIKGPGSPIGLPPNASAITCPRRMCSWRELFSPVISRFMPCMQPISLSHSRTLLFLNTCAMASGSVPRVMRGALPTGQLLETTVVRCRRAARWPQHAVCAGGWPMAAQAWRRGLHNCPLDHLCSALAIVVLFPSFQGGQKWWLSDGVSDVSHEVQIWR